MEVIQIGSIAILLKWVLLGLAILLGLLYMKFRLMYLQKHEIQNKEVFDLIFNSLFLGFLIWKGSMLILEPSLIIKSPFSLLYFTGGTTGLLFAITGSVLIFIYKAQKMNIPNLFIYQTVFIFTFVVLSSYHILALLFLDEHKMSHLTLGLFTLVTVSISFFKKNMLSQQAIFTYLILFSFLSLIQSFVIGNMDNKLFYLFSIEQWFLIVIIIVSLFYWDKKSTS